MQYNLMKLANIKQNHGEIAAEKRFSLDGRCTSATWALATPDNIISKVTLLLQIDPSNIICYT